MGACACIGPVGNCPCIREARGEKLPPSSCYIAGDVLACLTPEELKQFEDLKMTALSRYICNKKDSI